MILYPYQNYHLFSEMNLKYLFGAKEAYTVSFKVNGSRQEKSLPLKKYNGFLDFTDDSNFLAYEIQGNKMIFRLDVCIYNEEYQEALEKLARLCKERRLIDNLHLLGHAEFRTP